MHSIEITHCDKETQIILPSGENVQISSFHHFFCTKRVVVRVIALSDSECDVDVCACKEFLLLIYKFILHTVDKFYTSPGKAGRRALVDSLGEHTITMLWVLGNKILWWKQYC